MLSSYWVRLWVIARHQVPVVCKAESFVSKSLLELLAP